MTQYSIFQGKPERRKMLCNRRKVILSGHREKRNGLGIFKIQEEGDTGIRVITASCVGSFRSFSHQS